jgi:hypothetical protein
MKMPQHPDRPRFCPDETVCPDGFGPDQLWRISAGPNANTTKQSQAGQGFFVSLKLSVAKILRAIAARLE